MINKNLFIIIALCVFPCYLCTANSSEQLKIIDHEICSSSEEDEVSIYVAHNHNEQYGKKYSLVNRMKNLCSTRTAIYMSCAGIGFITILILFLFVEKNDRSSMSAEPPTFLPLTP